MENINLSVQLRNIRNESKTKQVEIASAIDVHPVTYNRWELGKTEPNINILCDIADYYHVTLDYLVGRNFASDMGYLSDIDREALENFKRLNAKNKTTMLAELRTAVLIQNSN